MSTKTIKKKVKRTQTSIIIKTTRERVDSLKPFHKNPRKGDVEKVAESLKENGQFKPIIVNVGTKTGRKREILGGNHTWKGAKRLKWEYIEVSWVDVDEVAANKIVLADNGASDGSTYDDQLLTELLSDTRSLGGTLLGTTYTDDTLAKLVKKTGEQEDPNASVDKISDASEHLDGVRDLSNGLIFPSDLPYDMPELRLDMIPDKCPEPLEVFSGHEVDGKDIIGEDKWKEMWWLAVWHTGCRGINWRKSIPCFYTDDFHFDPVYTDPAKNTKKILNLGISGAMMPNYTIYNEMPIALWVWAAYRSFYVARYFQEAGIQVIPDIQTGGRDEVMDISLLGIPQGAPVVAAQAQMARGDRAFIRQKARLLKEAEDRLGFKSIIIYGHTDADEVVERANFDCEVIRVSNRTARRREYLNSGATINAQKVTTKRKKVKK